MFDFTNYTYSAVITFISTLFGLAYPLIIGCIEKIDSRFHSTLLTARFKQERSFICFKVFLIINLFLAVLMPFLLDGYEHSRWLVFIQVLFVLLLIFYALKLFYKIMVYYDPVELNDEIVAEYYKYKIEKNKGKEAEIFKQWADLSSVLLSSADEKLVMSVYDVREYYLDDFVQSHNGEENRYDDYFYEALTRINENLCKSDRRPITINNSNSILATFIYYDMRVSTTSYTYLWKNIKIQLFYGREDWIVKYWQVATTTYTHYEFMEDEGKLQKEDSNKFLEFHIMLCAILLREKKHQTLKQILNFSQTGKRTFPLVPSRLSDIIAMFNTIMQKTSRNPNYLDAKYTVLSLYGLDEEEAQGELFKYLALLIYRLYTLTWFNGPEMVFNGANIPQSLSRLRNFNELLNLINFWLKKINTDHNLLAILDIDDFQNQIDELNNKYSAKDYKVLLPEEYIDNIQEEIGRKVDDLKVNQEYDNQKVETLFHNISDKIKEVMACYDIFMNKSGNIDELVPNFKLDASVSQLFPSTAFVKEPDISYVDIDNTMSYSSLYKFFHFIVSTFYIQTPCKVYNIANKDLFKAIDNLKLGDKHIIISFDIYWDYYINHIKGLTKISNFEYKYQQVCIINLPSSDCYFSQTAYILKKENMPVLSFADPKKKEIDDYSLKKVDDQCHIWLSLFKVKDHNDVIPNKQLDDLGSKADEYSALNVVWYPQLFIGNISILVRFNVKYKGVDEGNCSDVDSIPSFESLESK